MLEEDVYELGRDNTMPLSMERPCRRGRPVLSKPLV